MEFRDRGGTVRLIRTTYDDAAKEPKSEVLAKVKRPELELTDEERAKFTPQELEEFEAYRRGAIRSINIEQDYAAYRFSESLELASAWLSNAPREEALGFGLKVQKPLRTLRRQLESLKNTGDVRSAKRSSKKREDNENAA